MKLDEKDVRQIVKIVADAPLQKGGHAAAKRFLMEGLARLIDANAWVWALQCQRDLSAPQIYVSFAKGGFAEEAFAKFLEACERPEMIELASNFFSELQTKNKQLTRSRHQIVPLRRLARAEVMSAWKAANIGPTIMSAKPLDQTSSSMVGLYRHFGRPEFSDREVQIAHIVLTEVSWLHEQGWPEDRGATVPKLSRRERLTLNLLIGGQSQKEIAHEVGLSLHTVRDYIKAVYRHFGVNSQAQLMRRFYQGEGLDVR